MSSCLRMPVAPGTSSPFAIFVRAPTLMSLSVDSSSFSGGGRRLHRCLWGRRAAAARCARRRLLLESVDQCPQFVQSFTRDRRDRQHGSFQHGFECSQGADPFAASQLVDFRRHHRRLPGGAAYPLPRRPVGSSPGAARPPAEARPAAARTRPRRWPRIRPRSPAAPRRRPARPWAPARSRNPADPAVERRAPAAGDAIDVRQPRLAGRGARARNAPAHQRVDQARFADIRAPDEGDLSQAVPREIACTRRAQDEARLDLQRVISDGGLQISD